MPLDEYAKKRKFDKTPEPGPGKPRSKAKAATGGLFCVQRHDASHLHYDLRLEIDGALASWAVPKGPTLDSTRKSLAMKVEDHPMEYAEFEGNIPAGNYGAGSVMLWDIGRYTLLDEPPADQQLARGDFKFSLEGSKLRGAFALVRMKRGQKGNEWLLIKKPDEYAVPGWTPEEHAWSVKTKRSQEEIAANDDPIDPEHIDGSKKAAMPKSIKPMLATLVDGPPSGEQWLYEIKWDGVRALCFIEDGKLRIESRNGKRVEAQYPELASLPSLIQADAAIVDGEIAVLDEQGRARFELIQPRISTAHNVETLQQTNPAHLFLFDLLYLDGYDLRGVPLETRKGLLEKSVEWNDVVRYSQHFTAETDTILEAVQKMGVEGIVAKDRRSPYEAARSKRWLKVKAQKQQEFVIAGFVEGEREYFGSLVLGVNKGKTLQHAGQVGTGFDAKQRKAIFQKLEPLVSKHCPLSPKPRIKGVTWVEPELVCEVRFLEWTSEGMLRAPVFVGLREDKPAAEVVREVEQKSPRHTAKKRAPAKVAAVDQSNTLNLSGKEAVVEIEGHTLKLTNLDKVYFPKDGYTKRDLLRFYDEVSPWLLPHLKDRPLSLKRYPNGIDDKFFFQKNASEHFVDWLRTEPVREGHPPKTNNYAVAHNRASLIYLVNLGCIDHNPWLSRIGSLTHPDWILIDLDPFHCPFDRVVEAAQIVRGILNRVGLKGYPKTTGGDGLHVYVPLDPIYTYDQARSFAEILFHLANGERPDLFTAPRSVGSRKKNRVYFDWQQIGTGKTIAAPYVVRAYDGAPVSTPLAWSEVKQGLDPKDFTIKNVLARFSKKGDLFAPVLSGGQRLESALKKLQ